MGGPIRRIRRLDGPPAVLTETFVIVDQDLLPAGLGCVADFTG
jgi:hypothetical protein